MVGMVPVAVSMQSQMPRGPLRHDEPSAAEPHPKERGCVRLGPAAAAPQCSGVPVEIRGVPCGQRAAAGAPRTQPRSGRNPRGARGFCGVVVQRGGAAPKAERDRSPVAAGGVARERRNFLTTSALRTRWGRGRPVPVPEGRRRRLAGGKSVPADAAPGFRAASVCAPTGHRRKWPEATSGGENTAGRTPPKNFFDAPLGHGPFGGATGGRARWAGLPPANFLRSPSGTKRLALATILWSSAGGQGSGEILARREAFSRSAAVNAEHQPEQVGRRGRLGFQRVPPRFRGRCGWSSADTAALRGLRLRRSVVHRNRRDCTICLTA